MKGRHESFCCKPGGLFFCVSMSRIDGSGGDEHILVRCVIESSDHIRSLRSALVECGH